MSSLLDHPDIRSAVLSLTVRQYRRLGEAGIINERTELLRGMIFKKMNKSPLHTWTVQKLKSVIECQLSTEYSVRKEDPLTLSHSEPEPDLAVVEGGEDVYRQAHPATAMLVVEVALVTESMDREKASIYAEAGVPEYWLVLPEKQHLIRYSHLHAGRYSQMDTIPFDQKIEALGNPKIVVSLRDLVSP